MIPLIRNRSEKAVPRSLRGKKLLVKLRKLFKEHRDIKAGLEEKHDFKTGYWKPAKGPMLDETHNKCAYCEADVRVVAHGDVEHYRPKSKYWWLAYTYDNYLFSCQICNQSYKSNEFPISGNELQAPPVTSTITDTKIESLILGFCPEPYKDNHNIKFSQFLTNHRNEDPDLINPYYSDPEPFFHWEAIDTLKEVKIRPNKNKPDSERFVDAAIEYYGLNREELKTLRYEEFKKFRIFKKFFKKDGDPDAKEMIKDMKNPEAPFSGMMKYFDELL